jgi:hypothetical protein
MCDMGECSGVAPGGQFVPSVALAASAGTYLANLPGMTDPWSAERDALLGKRISDIGLAIEGSRVERLVAELYRELDAKGIRFRPPVYLSDQWGCPDETPLIGVPFYLADERLERIEAEMAGGVEDDGEALRYLRHEAGHAINYAFRFFERPEWRAIFGSFAKPYRDRYRADPFSRSHVRHILGWYAQKHPDEDFAETFAVWLTPGIDWHREYEGWPALAKLEYMDRLMREIAETTLNVPAPVEDDLPVEAMRYTVADHYAGDESMPIDDPRQFDADLRRIFLNASQAPACEPAPLFVHRHYREIVGRITYWTSEPPSVVRSLIDHVIRRSRDLDLRVGGLEASTLIELTAFGTAVAMQYREARRQGKRAAQ